MSIVESKGEILKDFSICGPIHQGFTTDAFWAFFSE